MLTGEQIATIVELWGQARSQRRRGGMDQREASEASGMIRGLTCLGLIPHRSLFAGSDAGPPVRASAAGALQPTDGMALTIPRR